MTTYDPEGARRYFDRFADREWQRLEATLQGRVKYAVHRRMLERHLHPGMRVLDVGSGPGRFAIDIARLGATVTLVDLSQVQLDLARDRLVEANAIAAVEGFHRLDVLDLSSLGDSSYDAVVCFGGAVSYTRDRFAEALLELRRVARRGAPILMSVMSLFGALRLAGPLHAAAFLESPESHLDWHAVLRGDDIVFTNPASREFHLPLALFSSRWLRRALEAARLDVTTIATSDPLLPEFQDIPRINASQRAADNLIALALAELPGLADAGAYLLAAAVRPNTAL